MNVSSSVSASSSPGSPPVSSRSFKKHRCVRPLSKLHGNCMYACSALACVFVLAVIMNSLSPYDPKFKSQGDFVFGGCAVFCGAVALSTIVCAMQAARSPRNETQPLIEES